MRSGLLLALLAAAEGTFAVSSGKFVKHNVASGRERVPGRYIVEFEDGSDTADFYKTLSKDGVERLKLDYKLFKGASIQLKDTHNADARAQKIAETVPAVKKMYPVELYTIPKPKVEWTGKESESSSTSAASKRAAGAAQNKNLTDTDYPPHVMTQIDKLRAKGYTGKGIKIAEVDTGIDYTHPALGGCFGKGCLVSFGYDLVGDAYTGSNTPIPDSDPMDCNGHGTHVAGIIAAQPNKYNFTGAAPEVTLGAYRALGCEGGAGNDVLIAAYNLAYEAGADIITASIGGPSGWSEDPWAVVVSRIVAKGVPCTLAAGNEGSEGQMYASGAADGKHVTSIASYDNTHTPTLLSVSYYTVDKAAKKAFGYTASPLDAWGGVKLPLYAPSFDTNVANGGCDPYPANTPDLSGYIVLIRRGSCSFTQKGQNAAKAGAKYFIVYNNVPGTLAMSLDGLTGIKSAAMVTSDVGVEWIKDLKAGKKVTLEMIASDKAETQFIDPLNPLTGGALSTYTTWGPTWEMDLKPQFGAPGGNILSTYPVAKGSYAVLSGTSMATPQAAGIYALIAQVRGSFNPAMIENTLAANANPQLFNDGTSWFGYKAPVTQQGAGLMQAYDAAFASTTLSPSGLSFNDTTHGPKSLKFTITNNGKKAITYSLSNVAAMTFYTLDNGDIYPEAFPNDPVESYATIKLSKTKVQLSKGQSETIEVQATPPQGVNATRLPIWSGWVAVNGTDGSSLSIPYQGLAGDLKTATVLGPEDVWIANATAATAAAAASSLPAPVPDNTTFNLPPKGSDASAASVDDVILQMYLALGSSEVAAYLVPLTTCPPGWVYKYNGYKVIGQPYNLPALYNTRGSLPIPFNGLLASGKYAPAGKYKIVVFALKLYGDPKKDKDWDVAETQPFRIKYAG